MHRAQRQLTLLAALLFIAVLTTFGLLSHEDSPYQLSLNRISLPWSSSTPPSDPLGIGFLFRTFIISLPHRQDRREDIDTLMSSLSIPNWHYQDGTYANTSLIKNFMKKVQAQRTEAKSNPDEWAVLPFSWPEDARSNYTSNSTLRAVPLPPAGSELWPEDPSHNDDKLYPLMCAVDDFKLQKYTDDVIQWRHLTPERVATFHSHQSAIRRAVDDNARLGVDLRQWPNRTQDHISLILEDDVDMEVDIEPRMAQIMPLLPYDWDVLFLGYCWSEEDHHPALVGEYSRPSKNQVHPSYTPRCLHAYAVSPAGALRLLTHLRNPPFAYSRSVDEAFEWLVWEKRVKSFTVVPPVIIQRKVTKTDISLEGNDLWRESLDRGVLGTTKNGEEVR